MYESPIKVLIDEALADFQKREDACILSEINRKMHIQIDEEELANALRYDREQYERGFYDAKVRYGGMLYQVKKLIADTGNEDLLDKVCAIEDEYKL